MMKKMTTIQVLFSGVLLFSALVLLTPTSSLKQLTQPRAADVGNPITRTTTPKEAGVATSKQHVIENYGKVPLVFEANQGQADKRVKFMSRGSGYNLYLTPTAAVLTLRKASAKGKTLDNHSAESGPASKLEARDRSNKAPAPVEMTTVRMKLVGGNEETEVVGAEPQSSRVNYFIGNDPAKWRTDVPTYAKVQYKDVYPGVDIVYHGQQRQMEYDFVVKPGADPKQIRLKFAGAKMIRIDESGDLVLTTKGGEVRQHKPMVYQDLAGSRNQIAGSYLRKSHQEVAFKIGSYNPSLPLVIDPTLTYST